MVISSADTVIADGFTFVRLRCVDDGAETEALITPGQGANLCRVTHNGYRVIDFDPDLLAQNGRTGCFLMYPFPGRMRDNRFAYNGKTYAHPYSSSPKAYMHGVVSGEAFRITRLESCDGEAILTCYVDFRPGTPLYNLFPFENRFTVTYTLSPGRVRLDFMIEAGKETAVPFGLAAHPYFTRLCENTDITIRIPAAARMVSTPDLLPTGKLLATDGSYDLRRGRNLSGLALDDIYTQRQPGEKAIIRYAGIPLRTELDAGSSFTHFVVFTPPGKGFFCVENQTCSADAFNLDAKGFTDEAHLLEIPAEGVFTDWIEYTFVSHQSE
jgi:aldose 1-epimerase